MLPETKIQQFLNFLHSSKFYRALSDTEKRTLDTGYESADDAILDKAFAELQRIKEGQETDDELQNTDQEGQETDQERQIWLAAQAVDIFKDMQSLKRMDLLEREKVDAAASTKIADQLIVSINKPEKQKKKRFLFF